MYEQNGSWNNTKSLKEAFGYTSSRILFVFIDLFMVIRDIEGAGDDGPFETDSCSNYLWESVKDYSNLHVDSE